MCDIYALKMPYLIMSLNCITDMKECIRFIKLNMLSGFTVNLLNVFKTTLFSLLSAPYFIQL